MKLIQTLDAFDSNGYRVFNDDHTISPLWDFKGKGYHHTDNKLFKAIDTWKGWSFERNYKLKPIPPE